MLIPNRHSSTAAYRYGFQNQEVDNEIKGTGNSVNYKYRMHDPRLGRFFAVDPLDYVYPYYSPYAFSGNRVIDSKELEGLQPVKWWVQKTVFKDKNKGSKNFVYIHNGVNQLDPSTGLINDRLTQAKTLATNSKRFGNSVPVPKLDKKGKSEGSEDPDTDDGRVEAIENGKAVMQVVQFELVGALVGEVVSITIGDHKEDIVVTDTKNPVIITIVITRFGEEWETEDEDGIPVQEFLLKTNQRGSEKKIQLNDFKGGKDEIMVDFINQTPGRKKGVSLEVTWTEEINIAGKRDKPVRRRASKKRASKKRTKASF